MEFIIDDTVTGIKQSGYMSNCIKSCKSLTVLHKAQFSLLLLLVFCPQVVASVDLSQTSLLPANYHSHPAGLLFLQESFHVLAFIKKNTKQPHPQY